MNLLIAIDDTDNEESIGTGKLARMLADYLQEKGLAASTSVTRHQLLVHPDIPFTSHNSSACIEAISTNGDRERITTLTKDFLLKNFHDGADPGLCVVEKEAVPEGLRIFGAKAQQEVIKIQEAKDFVAQLGVFIWEGGGTGQGFIGAMAGIGLRSTGNDGRFIGLEGIREIKGIVSVDELLKKSRVCRVETESGEILEDQELVDTQNWVRPRLRNGLPILVVKKNGTYWQSIEKKKRKK